ncbi:hypothetical protein HZH66_000219 [Vespula vulgaris]|uniref:Uncharacterized protein n=1 Tax=Vespula vulgaris TaxID=7454 RepID=A0A834KR87_VESVU|nr:hypothetical protein HZH66_000219 [Vespula vulgaris]
MAVIETMSRLGSAAGQRDASHSLARENILNGGQSREEMSWKSLQWKCRGSICFEDFCETSSKSHSRLC